PGGLIHAPADGVRFVFLPSPPLRGRGVEGEGARLPQKPLTPNPSPRSTAARGARPDTTIGLINHVHRPCAFCFHSQMIQSTFFGSPPKSLSRVMHWPR